MTPCPQHGELEAHARKLLEDLRRRYKLYYNGYYFKAPVPPPGEVAPRLREAYMDWLIVSRGCHDLLETMDWLRLRPPRGIFYVPDDCQDEREARLYAEKTQHLLLSAMMPQTLTPAEQEHLAARAGLENNHEH